MDKILSYKEFLILEAAKGGEASGKLELVKITFEEAKEFMEKEYKKYDRDFSEITNFKKNFDYTQKLAGKGKTKRKDMPVIDNDDVDNFKRRLEKGTLDIKAPWAESTLKGKPFPEGLSGYAAQDFLERGLNDGSKNDDVVNVRIEQKKIKDLKPIQKQIYFDKALGLTAKGGKKATIDFLTKKSFFVTSKDNFIIDGHHRWLSGNILDPEMVVNCLDIDLDLKKLLPLSLSYGDAIGNKRNA